MECLDTRLGFRWRAALHHSMLDWLGSFPQRTFAAVGPVGAGVAAPGALRAEQNDS